jgi:dTDP-glucose pyrophosphorylase
VNYKLCIIAAGLGSRMGDLTKNINKALLPLNNKAAISHVIEKHDSEVEIIVAVNYEKEKIIEYLECAYPERNIKFVVVDKIKGYGSGPGYSLLLCKKYLDSPFILSTIDTIFIEKCPNPYSNWMGIDLVKNSKEYCTVKEHKNQRKIKSIHDKVEGYSNKAFIGIAGIKDYKLFFSSLISNRRSIGGEFQVSDGFIKLIDNNLETKKFTWYDIGNLDGYREAIKKFSNDENRFDFSKFGENIYFIGSKVIKFFSEESIVKNRIKRAEYLKGLVPEIIKKKKYFYSYNKVEGKVIYDVREPKVTKELLIWLTNKLWIKKNLNHDSKREFRNACHNFYFDKTIKRLNIYYEKFKIKDEISLINNLKIPKVKLLLESIDFDWLSNGIASGFHGDLQFDNIILTSKKEFKLIDWRQDFSGIIEYGDKYYDLAKLNGGLYISYKNIKRGDFNFSIKHGNINLNYEKDKFLVDSKKIFNSFILNQKLDIEKIEILTSLIFLNMAPMHNEPFSHYVYNMGKYNLFKFISEVK